MSRKGFFIFILLLLPYPAAANYIVQVGDNIGSIAKKFKNGRKLWGKDGFAVELARANKLENRDLIFPGDQLIIPNFAPSAASIEKNLNVPPDNEIKREPAQELTAIPEEDAAVAPISIPDVALLPEDRPALLRVSLAAGFWNRNVIDSTTGASGALRSKGIYGVDLVSSLPISEETDIETAASFRSVTFLKSTTRSLVREQSGFLKFGAGGVWHREKISWGAGLQFEQVPQLTGMSATALAISSFTVFSPYLKMQWRWKKWKKTNAALSFFGAYHLPSSIESYELRNGWSAEIGLPISREISPVFSYGFTPYLGVSRWITNTVKHSDIEPGFRADFVWRF